MSQERRENKEKAGRGHGEKSGKIALVMTLPLLLYLLWWNSFAYLGKLFMMGDFLHNGNYTADTYVAHAEELMDFHPEIQEDTIPMYTMEGVRNIIQKNPDKAEPDARKITTELEPYMPQNPHVLIYVGRIYSWLYLKNKDEPDYEKTVGYFQECLKLSPLMPSALYDLHAIYLIHGDTQKADELKKIIETNYGVLTEEQSYSII